MSEYIITDKQFKTITEVYLEHKPSLPITAVFISGDKLPEIVRCKDCKWYGISTKEYFGYGCMKFHFGSWNKESLSNGFCAWGEMRDPVPPDSFCAWGELRGEEKTDET